MALASGGRGVSGRPAVNAQRLRSALNCSPAAELAHLITELLAGERYPRRATSRESGDGLHGSGHGAVLVLQGIEAGQPEDGRLAWLSVPTICSGDNTKVPSRVLRVMKQGME